MEKELNDVKHPYLKETEPRLLIIDDEYEMCRSLEQLFREHGYTVFIATSAKDGLKVLQRENIDLIICDIVMPDMSGLLFLSRIGSRVPVIMITAYASIETTRKAFKLGACDYLVKPFDFEELVVVVNQNLKQKTGIAQKGKEYGLIQSRNSEFLKTLALAEKFSKTDMPVLITGESGAGKEVIAKYIFENSMRNNKPFISLNCAAIPEALLESELFGYEKGAFTGANTKKTGKFEEANGGTLFLDEIGDMPLHLQAKMLRILQDFSFYRLGGHDIITVDTRILAASNKNLPGLIKDNLFREDLYHRLNGVHLKMPPLRERTEDIDESIRFFIDFYTAKYNKKINGVDNDVLQILKNYNWPGNIRELKNCIERAVVVCDGEKILPEHLPDSIMSLQVNEVPVLKTSVDDYRDNYMRRIILEALDKTNGSRNEAANLLKISRKTLYNRMKDLDIDMISSKPENGILVLENVTVSTDSKIILDSINLNVAKGEIHAVVGGSGSGKSTLVDVISGNIQKTKGKILFENEVLDKNSPGKMENKGVATIYQYVQLVQQMKVYENVFLKRAPTEYKIVLNRKKMRERFIETCKSISLNLDPDRPVSFYNNTEQYFIEIIRLFCFPFKLVIIDEISKHLLPKDVDTLHYLLSLLQNEGVTILYFTHNMDETFNFASRISVIDNGKIVETVILSSAEKFKLVQLTYASLSSRQQLENINLELYYINNVNHNIINSIPIPILVVNSRNQIILINRLFESMTGLEQNQIQRKPVDEIIKLQVPEIKALSEEQNEYKIYDIPDVQVAALPRPLQADFKVISLIDEDNSFIGTIFMVTRLEGGVLFENKINQNDAMSLKKSLFGISHELNNPLGIVLNYLKLIKQSKSLKDIQSNVEIIEKEIKRMKRFIKNSFSLKENKTAAGSGIRYSGIIGEVVLSLKPEVEKKKIRLSVDVMDDAEVQTDPDMVKQVILNIVLNGIEAVHSEIGEIKIELKSMMIHKDKYSVVEIRDNGPGIPEESLCRIFDPFFTTKAEDGSRGLGLSLSQDMVKGLNGYIEVNNVDRGGAVFQIYFPAFE